MEFIRGRDCLLQPPQGLHRSRRHTWQSATPWPGPATSKRVSFLDPLVSTPSCSPAPPGDRRFRNHFSSRGLVFCMPWTGGAIPVSRAMVPAPSVVNNHRGWTSGLSSCRPTPELRGEPCGDWPTPLVSGQASWQQQPCTLAPSNTVNSPCI